jgi:3-oxoacyl-[acyl-carrier protein] reductase
MLRFDGRTIAVSGASRGLGRALALAFARQGAFVYVGYRTRALDAEATLTALREAGGDGAVWQIDVRDATSVDTAVTRVVAERDGIDVLVNNAGVARDEPLAMMSAESWQQVLDVNLGGVFRLSRAAARPMLARGRGAIVNIGSVAGLHASPGQANYAAAKGGLLAFTRTLAAELAPRGVRVNAVVPGLLSTGMAARLDHRVLEKRIAAIPLGRTGSADEVAAAVLFVASDEASYLIGQALVVDGGLTL